MASIQHRAPWINNSFAKRSAFRLQVPVVVLIGLSVKPVSCFFLDDVLRTFPFTCAMPLEEDVPFGQTSVAKLVAQAVSLQSDTAAASALRTCKSICERISKNNPENRNACLLDCRKIAARESKAMEWCGNASVLERACQRVQQGKFCAMTSIHGEQCVILDPQTVKKTHCKIEDKECKIDRTGFQALSLECPPGFYCPGGVSEPRVCKKGNDCSAGAAEPRECQSGHFCLLSGLPVSCDEGGPAPFGMRDLFKGAKCEPQFDGRTPVPIPCPKGRYCENGISQVCPVDHMCPPGTSLPYRCKGFEICPAGSEFPTRWPRAIINVLANLGVTLFALLFTRDFCGRKWWRISIAVSLCCVVYTYIFEFVRKREVSKIFAPHTWFITFNFAFLLYGLLLSPILRKLIPLGNYASVVDGVLLAVVSAILYVTRVIDGYSMTFLAFGVLSVVYAHVSHGSDANIAVPIVSLTVMTTVLTVLPVFLRTGSLRGQAAQAVFICLLMCPEVAKAFWHLVTMSQEEQEARENVKAVIRENVNSAQPSWGVSAASLRTQPRPTMEMASFPFVSTEGASSKAKDSELVLNQPCNAPSIGISLEQMGLLLPNGKAILNNVTLTIPAGGTAAVMGPSGSGKSSITNVLSGRAGYGVVTGKIIVNDNPLGPTIGELSRVSGFVPQDDVMHRNLTVFENIYFQAEFRLSKEFRKVDVNWAEIEAREVVAKMGLDHVSSSLIGDEKNRGISGGQRKRVSIGMELVCKPSLLFLDEPTSGLDSTMSHEVIRLVTSLAKETMCTSIAVIHQPRYQTLMLFDEVVLLATGGFLAYAGPTKTVSSYFKQELAVKFPPVANPADVFMDAISLDSAKVLVAAGEMQLCETASLNTETFGLWLSQKWESVSPQFARPRSSARAPVPNLAPEASNWGDCVLVHIKRASWQTWREAKSNLVFIPMLSFGLIVITLAMPAGAPEIELLQPGFALFFLMLVQVVQAQKVFGGNERFVAWREASVGMKSILYFLGKDLCALAEIYCASAIFASLYYPLTALNVSAHRLMWTAFAFIHASWGMSFIWSIILEPAASQIVCVVCTFVSFMLIGLDPSFQDLLSIGRGSAMPQVIALSPIRWAWSHLLMRHLSSGSQLLNPMIRELLSDDLRAKGLPVKYLQQYGMNCDNMPNLKIIDQWFGCTRDNRALLNKCEFDNERPPNGLTCSLTPLFLLGMYYRCVALMLLIVISKNRAKGGAPRYIWHRVAERLFICFCIAASRFQLKNILSCSNGAGLDMRDLPQLSGKDNVNNSTGL